MQISVTPVFTSSLSECVNNHVLTLLQIIFNKMGNLLSRLGRTIRRDRQGDPVHFSRNQNRSRNRSFQSIQEVHLDCRNVSIQTTEPEDQTTLSTSYSSEHQPSTLPSPGSESSSFINKKTKLTYLSPMLSF